MNRLEAMQTGGFPLETDTLDFMQTTYNLLNSLGFIAGDLAIINGCDINGTSTGDGVVFMNDELLPFVGGITQARAVIVEETETRNFEDGTTKIVFKNRYATFGNGPGSRPWDEFVKIEPLKLIMETVAELKARMLPPKTEPKMYCGLIAEIPPGYQLCDGTNGTPNLKNKFIVGYDPNDTDYSVIGNTGGSKKHTLTIGEMPSHSHNMQNQIVIQTRGKSASDAFNRVDGAYVQRNTDSAGNNQPHENRPPYFTLAYIIWVGL